MIPAVYVIYALLATAFLSINMPPFQNADEVNHFLRADQLSRFVLVGERFGGGLNSGGLVASGIVRSAAIFEPALKLQPDHRATLPMYAQASTIGWGGPLMMAGFANTSIYPPIFYIPSVIGIWIGKLAGISVIRTLYLARIFTGLSCCALIATALTMCVRAGMSGVAFWIFAIVTLPMSLAVQNSCSQDGLMLAVTAVAVSLFARLRKESSSIKDFIAMCICLACIVAARPPYVAFSIIPFALMKTRMRSWGAVSIAAACGAWTGVSGYYAGVDTTSNQGANIGAQVHVLFSPMHDVTLIYRTLEEHGSFYLSSFVGRLGWLDLLLSPIFVYFALCALAAVGILVGFGSARLRQAPATWVYAATLTSILGVFVSLYLVWTPVGADVVDGVQGRYLIPIALILGCLWGRLPRLRGSWTRCIGLSLLGFPIISLGVISRELILRYYLG